MTPAIRIFYMWAKNIGNRDVMINKITDSLEAYFWAIEIGNIDIMIDRITDDELRKEVIRVWN